MNAVIARIKEPSTSAGLAALAQVAKVFFPQWGAVLDAVAMLTASLAVALPEGKAAP